MQQQPEDWKRLVYRASRLDEFRLYLSGVQWDGATEYTTEDFVKRLTTFEPSPAMSAGTAVHAVIEKAAFGELPASVTQDGWRISFSLDAELPIPTCREIPLYREHKGIPLYGRVDAIDANAVHDLKTTGAVNIDTYGDSFQWRAYLYMSGRREFVFHILRVKLDEPHREVTVLDYIPARFSAYPALERDVEMLLEEYHAAIVALGIEDILTKRETA